MHVYKEQMEPYVFLCAMHLERFEKCCMQHQEKQKEFYFFLCRMQHFCCMKQTFLSVAPRSHSMKRFREAKLLLANHETCLKCSILKRMFGFKNICKQFYFKNNMVQGKMADQEKQRLISFYKQNPILWENADPNYRNKVKRSFFKGKLVTLFDTDMYFHPAKP